MFTQDQLQKMEIERISENHETLHDVPIELCLDNAFEVEESDGVRNEEGEEVEVDDYIGTSRIGHPFLARRTADGKYEVLGSNDVLASARQQGITKLGIVHIADYPDKKWLLMSWYSRGVDVRRGYHMWNINKSVYALTDQQFHAQGIYREWICDHLDLMKGITIGNCTIDDTFIKQLCGGTSANATWRLADKVLRDIGERYVRLKAAA
jgi:hypothetical protein